jgi:hypothetical protein
MGAFIALLAGSSAVAGGDGWNAVWHRTIPRNDNPLVGPSMRAVTSDSAGFVYVTATVGTSDGWSAMVLAKYTPQGSLVWRRSWRAIAGFHRHTVGRSVSVAPDGSHVYVGGAQLNDSTEDAVPRVWSYTSSGDLRWTRIVWSGSAAVTAVAARGHGVVVGGHSWSECAPVNGLLAAVDASGTRRWVRDLDPRSRGDVNDEVRDVAVGPAGRIYVVGTQDTKAMQTCGDSGDSDAVIQKRGPGGGLRWSRTVRDPDVRDWDRALGVAVRGDRVMVVGERDATATQPGRGWVMQMTIDGTARWRRAFDRGTHGSAAVDVAIARWGPIYVVARVGRDTVLRRFTVAGDVASSRRRDATWPSGVAAEGPALYVSGGSTVWRMPW